MELIDIPAASLYIGLSADMEERLQAMYGPSPFPCFREQPRHRVYVAAFAIGRAPVTNAEFLEMVREGGYTRDELWESMQYEESIDPKRTRQTFVDQGGQPGPLTWRDGAPPEDRLDHPVSGVSWFEARAFAAFKRMRLPSEAEWELAAGGIEGRCYPWGEAFDADRCACHGDTEPVTARTNGDSPFGVLHLAGNVAEWCKDAYQPYPGSDERAVSHRPSDRIVRGDFFNGDAETLRNTTRAPWPPERRFVGLGFRVAR